MSMILCNCGEFIRTPDDVDKTVCPNCGQKWIYVETWERWASSAELDERVRAVGVTNILERKKRYLQIDYDTKDLEQIEREIIMLWDEFDLNAFILMETNAGYHVISPNVMSIREATEALNATSADKMFKKKMRVKKYTTLRISPKYVMEGRKLEMTAGAPVYVDAYVFKPFKRPICSDVVKLYELLAKRRIMYLPQEESLIFRSKLQFVFYRSLKP